MKSHTQGQCQHCSNPRDVCAAPQLGPRLPAGRHRGAGAPHLPELAVRSALPRRWRAQQGRFHADGLLLPVAVATALGASRSEAGGRGSRIVSRRSSPRAPGTSNPALLHFRPPRSTEELSNDQLSGSEQALTGMLHTAIKNTLKSHPTAARWPWQGFPATCLVLTPPSPLSHWSHTSQLQQPQGWCQCCQCTLTCPSRVTSQPGTVTVCSATQLSLPFCLHT